MTVRCASLSACMGVYELIACYRFTLVPKQTRGCALISDGFSENNPVQRALALNMEAWTV